MNTRPDPIQLGPDSPALSAVLALIQDSFAYMETRIDPPSSMRLLTEHTLRERAREDEIWVIGDRPRAVVFLTPKPDSLYLSKLAVAQSERRKGLARRLVALAETRARAMGLDVLELKTRFELIENHAAFGCLGFVKTGETAHPGYDRLTSITMQKRLG